MLFRSEEVHPNAGGLLPLLRYNITAVDSFQQEGGVSMQILADFLLSVAASVAGYYICKWLDRNHKDS